MSTSDVWPVLIWAVYIFNLVDMSATLYFVEWLRYPELNPFMDIVLSVHPALFVFFKVGLMAGGLFYVYRTFECEETVPYGMYVTLWIVAVVYGLLALYHMVGIYMHVF
jgi:hypothetical protein